MQCSDFMLTKDMHCRIANIIVKAVVQHAPITVDETSTQYLVHSIKQVIFINLLISSMLKTINNTILVGTNQIKRTSFSSMGMESTIHIKTPLNGSTRHYSPWLIARLESLFTFCN